MVATSLQNLFHINYSHTHFGDQASDFPATNNFSAGSSLSTAVQALSVGVVFLFRS
jgi:hypothetical protein